MAERNSTQESVNGIEKALTGIEGFDEISGGLPRGRTTLVMGVTGAGKTVFALQTLVNRARQWAEPGIFVAFEENSRQIITNTATFGWDLPTLEQEKLFFLNARMSPDIVTAGEFDLIGLLASLEAKVNEMGAKRIVFDSVDVLLTLLDNPRTERQELYRIHDWLARMDLTGIMTARVEGSNPFTSTRYGFLQFMADCVVLLHHHVENRVSLREVRIVKYRGSTFAENEIPLVIGPTGIEIASFGVVEPDYEISSERISTGIPRLDDMLDGGYYRGTSILLTGAPGTAKSNLSGLFAEAVCQRGEKALYVSFDESSNEIVRNLASIGVQFEPHLASGLLRMYSARTEARSAEEHFVRLIALIKKYQPSFLVINPLSALVQAAGEGERISALAVAQRLLHLAKLTGITVICTSLLEGDYPQVGSTPLQISPMADTWIHLSYVIQGGERNRALSIIKSRGTRHSNQVHELLLSDQGVELADVYTAEGTILMGTLRRERERAEQLEKERFRVALERKQRELELTETQINAQIEALQHELELRRTELRGLVNEQERREEQLSETRGELGRLQSVDPDRSAPAMKGAPPEEGEGKRRTTSRRRKQNRPGDSS